MPKQPPRWVTVLTGWPPKDQRAAPAVPAAAATGPDHGFALGPHKRGTSVGWTWAVRIMVGLLLFAGLRVAVIVPIASAFRSAPPPRAVAAGLDQDDARRLAAQFTADYWSYDSSNATGRATALARWMNSDPASAPRIAGPGQLRADVVTPGAVVAAGPDAVVVQTTARVTPAHLPGSGSAATAAPATVSAAPGEAADPGPAQNPWTASRPVWLSLDVVVTRTGGLHVASAALSGDRPVALTKPTNEVDTTVSGGTGDLPKQVFTALSGSGQLAYLTVPHVQLTGLQGVVSLVDVSGWSVAADHSGTASGSRYATADVTWQLTGTQVSVTQPYALTISDVEGRWLLGAAGPRIEE